MIPFVYAMLHKAPKKHFLSGAVEYNQTSISFIGYLLYYLAGVSDDKR